MININCSDIQLFFTLLTNQDKKLFIYKIHIFQSNKSLFFFKRIKYKEHPQNQSGQING